MRKVLDKNCRENQDMHIIFRISFPRKSCRL